MINDKAHTELGAVRIGFRDFPVVRLDANTVRSSPVDARVAAIGELLSSRTIAVVECSPLELVDEVRSSEAAVNRGHKIQAYGTAHGASSDIDVAIEAMQLVADSLPDCAVEYLPEGGRLGNLLETSSTMLTFFPHDVFDLGCELGVIGGASGRRVWKSSAWRTRVMTVLDLPSRFASENGAWPASDCSRYEQLDPQGRATAKAMGLEAELNALASARANGRAIGAAVGKEQRVGWLAADLKLEHFIRVAQGSVAHIDHGDDVFLLREPTVSEMASCIAPVYQQMDYVQWQGFREGYVDMHGAVAVDVLALLEGEVAIDIMLAYCGKAASVCKNKGEFERALWYCSVIDTIGADSERAAKREVQLLTGKLVHGDVLMAANRFDDSAVVYRAAIAELTALRERGFSVGQQLCGGLINLAMACSQLGFEQDAAEYLASARELAEEIKKSDSDLAEHLLRVIDHNMSIAGRTAAEKGREGSR
jgi:hypothetical protein